MPAAVEYLIGCDPATWRAAARFLAPADAAEARRIAAGVERDGSYVAARVGYRVTFRRVEPPAGPPRRASSHARATARWPAPAPTSAAACPPRSS